MLARGFDPRLTIARDRESLDARLSRLDSSMALAVEGAVRTREVLVSALREANLEMPAANSAAIAKYISLAESGAAAMLEAAADPSYHGVGHPDRQRIRSPGGNRRIDSADAYDARVPGRDRFTRHTGRRGHQGKFLATIDDRFVGDRMRTASRRAWPANPHRSAAQSRCVGGALSKIQMDLRAVLPERACAMAREDGTPRTRGGERRARYFDALARLNAIAALGRPEGAHLGAQVAEVSARVVRCDLEGCDRARDDAAMSRVAAFSSARRRRRRNSKMRWTRFAAHSKSNWQRCRKA